MKRSIAVPTSVEARIDVAKSNKNTLLRRLTELESAVSNAEGDALIELMVAIDGTNAALQTNEREIEEAEADLLNYGDIDMTEDEAAEIQAEQAIYEAQAALGGHDTAHKALADIRWKKEVGGIEFGGMIIPTDRGDTRQNYASMRTKALEDNTYTVNYKLPSGFITLDANHIIGIADTCAEHVRKCFAAEADVYDAVESMVKYEDIEAAFNIAYKGA